MPRIHTFQVNSRQLKMFPAILNENNIYCLQQLKTNFVLILSFLTECCVGLLNYSGELRSKWTWKGNDRSCCEKKVAFFSRAMSGNLKYSLKQVSWAKPLVGFYPLFKDDISTSVPVFRKVYLAYMIRGCSKFPG